MNKDDLLSYLISKKRYLDTKERLMEFEMTIYYPPSPVYDGMPKSHTETITILSAAVDRHDELINQNNTALVAYITAGKQLDSVESRLNQTEADIIERRYRLGMKWENIAESINYSLRRTMEIHQEILEKISSF